MSKEERQQTILDLIRVVNIGTQDELTESLAKEGFSSTQSSVSRDLDELKIIKVNGFYALPPTALYYVFKKYLGSGLTAGAAKS